KNIDYNSGNQNIDRASGVTHSAQDAGTHIVNDAENHAQGIDAQIAQRHVENICGRLQQVQQPGRDQQSQNQKAQSDDKGQHQGCVRSFAHHNVLPGPKVLGNDYGGAAADTGEKTDE